MDNESKLLLEIWENFRDVIPGNKRDEYALTLLQSFQEYGFDVDYSDIADEDEHLNHAIEVIESDDDEVEDEE